jgi:Fic family protein
MKSRNVRCTMRQCFPWTRAISHQIHHALTLMRQIMRTTLGTSPTMDADDKDDDRYRAPALDKGLDILELLAEQKEGLTRAEITKLLGRNASEMYRMLERLVARQYVVRSAAGDRYSLSLKLYALPMLPNNRVTLWCTTAAICW